MHGLQDLTSPWPLLLESFSGKWGQKQDPRLRAGVKVNETKQAKRGSDATPSLRLPVSAVPLTPPSPPHWTQEMKGQTEGSPEMEEPTLTHPDTAGPIHGVLAANPDTPPVSQTESRRPRNRSSSPEVRAQLLWLEWHHRWLPCEDVGLVLSCQPPPRWSS